MNDGQDSKDDMSEEKKFRRMVINGWIIVCAMAFLFILYGFFAFFIVGDKGPPDWDYGSARDVPAESVESTYPYRGRIPEPEPQHVNQSPSDSPGGNVGNGDRSGPPKPDREKRIR